MWEQWEWKVNQIIFKFFFSNEQRTRTRHTFVIHSFVLVYVRSTQHLASKRQSTIMWCVTCKCRQFLSCYWKHFQPFFCANTHRHTHTYAHQTPNLWRLMADENRLRKKSGRTMKCTIQYYMANVNATTMMGGRGQWKLYHVMRTITATATQVLCCATACWKTCTWHEIQCVNWGNWETWFLHTTPTTAYVWIVDFRNWFGDFATQRPLCSAHTFTIKIAMTKMNTN